MNSRNRSTAASRIFFAAASSNSRSAMRCFSCGNVMFFISCARIYPVAPGKNGVPGICKIRSRQCRSRVGLVSQRTKVKFLLKIGGRQDVSVLAAVRVSFPGDALDRFPRSIKCCEKVPFTAAFPIRFKWESPDLDEKGDFKHAVVADETDTAPRFIITAARIWKHQSHRRKSQVENMRGRGGMETTAPFAGRMILSDAMSEVAFVRSRPVIAPCASSAGTPVKT
jgi:hypothetical protein